MKKIMNHLFLTVKFFLLVLAFGITLYIVLSMYKRVNKDIINSLPIFIPYIVLLLLFFINITLGQKSVNDNLFYNLTCCIVFSTICFVGLRSIFDKNMILNEIMGYNINFSYFSDFISFMKIMIYGLIIGNFSFMVHEKQIAHQIEVL